jgi:hypothetical protein
VLRGAIIRAGIDERAAPHRIFSAANLRDRSASGA